MCSRDQGSQEPMEGLVWAHLLPPPLSHTPTVSNDLYFPTHFLLFHTSVPLYMLFSLPGMPFSSWQTPPSHRHSSRVSSSMKCAMSRKADSSLLVSPQTRCPPLLPAYTALTATSLTGPWPFVVKWSKWMNEWWSLWPSALLGGQHPAVHSFWWARYPRGHLGENPRIGGRPRLAHSRLSVNDCHSFRFWLLATWMEAGWVEGHGTQDSRHPNLSLCLLCLSVSRNPTKGKKRPLNLPLEKSLVLWDLEVGWDCDFKASVAASHICRFLGCFRRLEGAFRSVHFFHRSVCSFLSLGLTFSWKVLQMLGKVGARKRLHTMTVHLRGTPATNHRDHSGL